ncbi:uncharacterized protein LOC120685476 [Panicum virgatum]|uniref:uncharacterized protein LOC120685476 n=1 Tax=Panicum virgatum TaxID=38727 RepID=UPI0019D4F1DD|nr:uncharacterized protein LOC120685476 [Panicum virgatum]
MSDRPESSSASRSGRRQERGCSSTRVHAVAYPTGKESGLPLIECPDCGLARVIELRAKKDTVNNGRTFFKCPRNGNPKYCDFYRFQKDYLDELILKKIVIIKCEQIEEVEEGSHGSMNDEEENRSRLEKLENLTWKMNCVFVVFGIVVLAMVVRSVVMA